MIARLDKTYSLLTKNMGEWFPETYKKLTLCVEFTQFIQHFFFSNLQRNSNIKHDAQSFIFKNNFMLNCSFLFVSVSFCSKFTKRCSDLFFVILSL